MPLAPDQFVLLTNILWDGSGPLVDQLQSMTIDVDGFATGGDFVGERTTALADDADNDGAVDDLTASVESITIYDSDALTGTTSNLNHTLAISGYTITLKDGTTFTDTDFGALPVRIQADNKVWIDLTDTTLSTLNGLSPIASISFDAGSTENDYFSGYNISPFDNAYTPLCFARGTLIEADGGGAG